MPSEGLMFLSSKKYLLKFHFRHLKINQVFWNPATVFHNKPKERHKFCYHTGQLDLFTNLHYLDLKLQSKEHTVCGMWD